MKRRRNNPHAKTLAASKSPEGLPSPTCIVYKSREEVKFVKHDYGGMFAMAKDSSAVSRPTQRVLFAGMSPARNGECNCCTATLPGRSKGVEPLLCVDAPWYCPKVDSLVNGAPVDSNPRAVTRG